MDTTASAKNGSQQEDSELAFFVIRVFWLSGIAVSAVCLLIQILTFAFIRISRKTDEKILTQITITRILATSSEYYLLYLRHSVRIYFDLLFTLYFVSDFALVCWMFVFTKNLYDKIVLVFPTSKLNLILTSIFIWTLSLPFGVIGVFMLNKYIMYFVTYCKLYGLLKLLLVIFTLLIYIKIFYVAIKTRSGITRNVRDVIKSACVACLLITTTCLQILVTDLSTFINGVQNIMLAKTFCVINSYHSMFTTFIFFIVLKGRLVYSFRETIRQRFSN